MVEFSPRELFVKLRYNDIFEVLQSIETYFNLIENMMKVLSLTRTFLWGFSKTTPVINSILGAFSKSMFDRSSLACFLGVTGCMRWLDVLVSSSGRVSDSVLGRSLLAEENIHIPNIDITSCLHFVGHSDWSYVSVRI